MINSSTVCSANRQDETSSPQAVLCRVSHIFHLSFPSFSHSDYLTVFFSSIFHVCTLSVTHTDYLRPSGPDNPRIVPSTFPLCPELLCSLPFSPVRLELLHSLHLQLTGCTARPPSVSCIACRHSSFSFSLACNIPTLPKGASRWPSPATLPASRS